MLLLLVLLTYIHGSFGAECSTACNDEFITGCIPYQCNAKALNGPEAYAACVSELGVSGPMAAKCVAECTPTTTMQAKESQNCDGTSIDPVFSSTCGEITAGGAAFDSCTGSRVYDSTKAAVTSPSDANCCKSDDPNIVNVDTGCSTVYCESCANIVKSTEPTLCTSSATNPAVYVFWPMTGAHVNQTRYFSIYFPHNVHTTTPALMIEVNGYGGEGVVFAGASKTAADQYNFALLQIRSPLRDGAAGFSLQFGNDGVANDQNPTPCEDSDSRDIPYLRNIFSWIEQQNTVDSNNVYAHGFSQNSMFAVYMTVCFADKMAGVWQGGSGLALTGKLDVLRI